MLGDSRACQARSGLCTPSFMAKQVFLGYVSMQLLFDSQIEGPLLFVTIWFPLWMHVSVRSLVIVLRIH
jgi:hypothetical protein